MARWIDIPPLWLALCAAVSLAAPRWGAPWPGWSDTLGLGLIAVGLGLMLAAVWVLWRARTTPWPHGAPRALVTQGVFRISRNPIYLGDALVLAGIGLRWDAVLALLLVPAFMLLVTRRFIAPEEQRLHAAFGRGFLGYAARVRRWL